MINESQPTVVLIGAGIAGISAAAALADHAQVTLIERETQPAYHATGRSAAIQSQAYGSPAVRALTRASDPFLSAPPDGFSEHPLLTPRGLISVARADQLDHLRAEYEENSDSALTWLDADEVESRLPLLRRGYAVAGFLNADAQDIDVHALVQGYLRQFRAAGGRLIRGAEVTEIRKTGDHWQLRAGDDILQADIVVNAAGASGLTRERIPFGSGRFPAGRHRDRRSHGPGAAGAGPGRAADRIEMGRAADLPAGPDADLRL